jgi:hypothetical protein
MRFSGHPYLKLGIMASGCPNPPFLRYCATCVAVDRSGLSETYWRRRHQLPGIVVCSTHHELLQDSAIPYRHSRNRHEYIAAENALRCNIEAGDLGTEFDIWMAEAATSILENPSFSCTHEELRPWLLDTPANRGFATWAGRIRASELKRELIGKYESSIVDQLGCRIESDRTSWIERLFHKGKGYQHPLRYLLLLHFVDATPSELFHSLTIAHPFGTGPWPCLNRASDHCGSMAVQTCSFEPSADGKNLVGTFRCDLCGMTYTRSGPDRVSADRMKWDHVHTYGPIWDASLCRLWLDPGYSLRGVARELGVDPITARRQALRLELPLDRPGYLGARVAPQNAKDKSSGRLDLGTWEESQRSQWLQLRERVPQFSVTQVRTVAPALYAWLYRHDREWLRQNSPTLSHRNDRKRQDSWRERDRFIAQSIQQAASRLRHQPKIVKLTRTALLREAGFIWLDKRKLKDLPITSASLTVLVDSRHSYALRRIVKVKSRYATAHDVVPIWKIIREAGLRPELLRDALIVAALRAAAPELPAIGQTSDIASQIIFDFA